MRILAALMLVAAVAAVSTVPLPTASACHMPAAASASTWAPGYYVVPGVGVGGCPHDVTVCTQVWRESNGQGGLQTGGSNPDTLVVLVCPLP